ncbi:hypothetical protein AB3M93_21145, partial [Novosphingobium panipatense]|uniref:hypothetical protein n=1 Tax=Novosphingobium panipatense TaxID=428991 RepID=UPI0039A1706E
LEIRHRSVRPISAKHAQASRFLQQSQIEHLTLGSGPLHSKIEASKWRRDRGWAGAAGSIATRKAARPRGRSHFGVPAGFDRFRPGLCQKALKYIHIPTSFFLTLNEIASNLDRGMNGS